MRVNMFRDNAIFIFVISAILIPLILITREIILTGIFLVLFIIAQIMLIYLFYREKTTDVEEWYVFWTSIASLVFALILVIIGKRVITEVIGLILFLIYFIGVLILLFVRHIVILFKKPEKKIIEQEDLESFREKDELNELVEFFEAETRPKATVVDIEEPKIDKIIAEEIEELGEYEMPDPNDDEWVENLPKSMVFEYEEEKKPKVRELKEAPKVDFDKVKKDLDRIDDGVKTISDKIRLISEKAILEGAEKKIKEAQKKKKNPKPKKTEIKVYASKSGTKYHFDKNCLGLKRVSKKNFVTYTNSKEARKKKLKKCDICK